jgi:hypothetical protein
MSNDQQVVLALPFLGMAGYEWALGEIFSVKIGDELVWLRVVEIRETTLIAEVTAAPEHQHAR